MTSAEPLRVAGGPRAAGITGQLAATLEATRTLIANLMGHATRLGDDVGQDLGEIRDELAALRAATRDGLGRVRDGVRATPRFARVSGELLRLAARYRAAAALRPTHSGLLGPASAARALERLHRSNARRLHDLCIELRGGVLKLGQFASSRVDLLPEAYVASLSRLQDRVPPVPTAAIRARVAEEIGDPAERFAAFEDAPIAAASLAQVHGAVLHDGRRVVVKVQVPGVERAVEADLAALRVAAPVLAGLFPGFDLETTAEELCRSVAEELDYLAEAEHAADFTARFADREDVVVPQVHRELSSRRVLVLERIDGVRLVDWLDACEARGEAGAQERDRLFEILLGSFCAQVLEHGLCHADPHPGNFLVVEGEPGPRLALLDFGSVQPYPPERRRAWASLALAILGRDHAAMSRLFRELGFASRSGDDATLRGFAELILERFREGFDAAAPEDPRKRVEAVLALVRDNPVVRIPGDFVQMGRVFAALGGLVLRYRPRIDLFALIAPRIAGALAPKATGP